MEENESIQIEKKTDSSCEGLNISNENDSYKEKEITIEVESIEKIDTVKVKEISIRVEFKGKSIAETESIYVPETGECAVNVSGFIPMEEPSPQLIDDILANPVIFTVIDRTSYSKTDKDILNEPKKDSKRDSKKALSRASLSVKSVPRSSNATGGILGICNMDIGPLIKGKKLIRENLIVELERSGIGQNLISWPKLPRLTATASAGEEPLIPEQLNVLNNIINITVESVYNVPRSTDEGTQFEAHILIPNFDDKLNPLVYPNGKLTNLVDCECKKRWVTLSHIEGRGALTKYQVNPDTSDIINPDKEISDLDKVIKTSGLRIRWNKWRSSVMVKTGSNFFFSRLTHSRVWPIEVTFASQSSTQKTGKGEKRLKTAPTTPSAVSQRFIAYLRLGSLLYPGVTRVRVASKLYTYSPSDVAEKCGADFVTHSVVNASLTKPKNGEKAKSTERDVEASKDLSNVLCNEDGNPVFIVVEVEVWKAYIPKREPEYFFERFNSYFPPKGRVSKKEMNLILARRNFSKVIEQLSYYIKDCYENYVLRTENPELVYYSLEDSFVQHLCHEGAFQKLKLTLEGRILDLVGEKYGSLGKDKEKITEVFIDLINEMQDVTNKLIMCPSEPFLTTEANDLQLSAEEAIEDGNFELARRYLLQKLWSNKLNPDYWLDYALYLIVLEEYDKCVEAIREALLLDMEHQMALLMYGLLMTKLNNLYLAELSFQVLLAKYPNFIEGWMIFHSFYSAIENLEGAEFTLQMVSRLENVLKGIETSRKCENEGNVTASGESGRDSSADLAEGRYGMPSFSKGRSATDPLSWTANMGGECNLYVRTAVLLLRLRSFELAESVLIKELRSPQGHSLEYYYYTAVSDYLRGRFSEAVSHLQSAIEKYGKNCFLLSLMGHCYYKLHNYDNCIECFDYVIVSYNRPNDIHLIHIRMGMYYMKTNKYKCAKKSFLTACKYSPSSETWLGLGAACYNLGDFEEAESALTEANYLDDMCPVVWAYLTLVNIQLERYDVVELCYAETKKKNLKNEELIAQIETLMEVHRLKN